MRRKHRTPLFTLAFVIVGLFCIWGLKRLYYDPKPVLKDNSLIENNPAKTSTLVPKLFIYTSESLKKDLIAETPESNTIQNSDALSENELISKVLLQQRHNLQRCYENHLRSQPDSKGEVLVELKLTPIGKASDIHIEKSDFKDPLFTACIESVLKRIQYKNLSGNDFIISIPLQFQ